MKYKFDEKDLVILSCLLIVTGGMLMLLTMALNNKPYVCFN